MENMLILSLALLLLGLIVTIVEIFVPSGGLLSIFAIFCFGGCLYCAYKVSGATAGVMAAVEVVCIPTVVAIAFKILPKTSLGKQLILSRSNQQKSPTPEPQTADISNRQDRRGDLQGCEGIAVTPLRPSGTAEFDNRRLSVVTEGSHIRNGTKVRVVLVEGNRVVVEAIDTTGTQAES